MSVPSSSVKTTERALTKFTPKIYFGSRNGRGNYFEKVWKSALFLPKPQSQFLVFYKNGSDDL